MGLLDRAKERLAYEKESWRMGQEHLRQVKEASPELYVKGYWRMTDAERQAAAKKGGKS